MNRVMKRTAVVFLMVAVLFALTPFAGGQAVYAGDSLNNAGDNIATSIDGSYKEITLRLINENEPGYMYDFEYVWPPWTSDSYTIEEVYMEEGIRNISGEAFYDMPSLREIWIPRSVTEIKPNALQELPALETIWYSGTWAQLTALKNSLPKGSSARTIIENADWQCTDRGSKEYTLRLDDPSGGPHIRVTDYHLNFVLLEALGIEEDDPSFTYKDFNNDGEWDMYVERINGMYDVVYSAAEGGATGLVMTYKLPPERGQYFYEHGVPYYQKISIFIPTEIQSSNVKLDGTSFPYAGYALTPGVTVTCGGKQLKEGTDFTASYSNNKEIGTATVTVTGKGNYYGTVSKSFNIIAKTCNIKNLWASQHMNGAVLFKWTKESSFTPSGWEVHYRTKKIGGGSWSGWTTKSFGAGTYQYKCPVKADYVVEIHARAKGDKSWSQGIITTPAGGKYQAMKTVYVKNAATNKRVDSITLKVGQSVQLKPDYVYPVTDYKKRPRLYPTQALWDLDVNGKGMLAIKKPDGSAYTGGMIDGAATITGRRAGTTDLICRAPNGRTKVLKVTVTP